MNLDEALTILKANNFLIESSTDTGFGDIISDWIDKVFQVLNDRREKYEPQFEKEHEVFFGVKYPEIESMPDDEYVIISFKPGETRGYRGASVFGSGEINLFVSPGASLYDPKEQDRLKHYLQHEIYHAVEANRTQLGKTDKNFRPYMANGGWKHRTDIHAYSPKGYKEIQGLTKGQAYQNEPNEINARIQEIYAFAKKYVQTTKKPFNVKDFLNGKYDDFNDYAKDVKDDLLTHVVPELRKRMLKRITNVIDHINDKCL